MSRSQPRRNPLGDFDVITGPPAPPLAQARNAEATPPATAGSDAARPAADDAAPPPPAP